jgi:hypothetical protein
VWVLAWAGKRQNSAEPHKTKQYVHVRRMVVVAAGKSKLSFKWWINGHNWLPPSQTPRPPEPPFFHQCKNKLYYSSFTLQQFYFALPLRDRKKKALTTSPPIWGKSAVLELFIHPLTIHLPPFTFSALLKPREKEGRKRRRRISSQIIHSSQTNYNYYYSR